MNAPPWGERLSGSALLAAVELYEANHDDLKPKQRREIDRIISQCRVLDTAVDQTLALFANLIDQKITAALGSKLKRPASETD